MSAHASVSGPRPGSGSALGGVGVGFAVGAALGGAPAVGGDVALAAGTAVRVALGVPFACASAAALDRDGDHLQRT